jgi:anti-anti-sigma factor
MTTQISSIVPPLILEFSETPNAARVLCRGKLLSNTTDLLYAPIATLIPNHRRIILDLSGLTQMDSMGLGSLVRLYLSARSQGSSLELTNLGQKVRDLLILTNLISVFTVVGEHGMKIG